MFQQGLIVQIAPIKLDAEAWAADTLRSGKDHSDYDKEG
jgi:hypothetical protein